MLAVQYGALRGRAEYDRVNEISVNEDLGGGQLELHEKGYQRGLDNDYLAVVFAAYLLEGEREKAVAVLAKRL